MLFERGTKYSTQVENFSKYNETVMFCCLTDGTMLPPYIIYKSDHLYNLWTKNGSKGKPLCCKECCQDGSRYNRTKSGWIDHITFSNWFNTCFLPHAMKLEGNIVLLGDNLSTHFCEDVLPKSREHNISFICFVPNSTHLSQPLDVGVFCPMKEAWRNTLRKFNEANPIIKGIPKMRFPGLLKIALDKMETFTVLGKQKENRISANIISGFRACGISRFDKNQVMKRLLGFNPNEQENLSVFETTISSYLKANWCPLPDNSATAPKQRAKQLNVSPGASVTDHLPSMSTNTEPAIAPDTEPEVGTDSEPATAVDSEPATAVHSEPTVNAGNEPTANTALVQPSGSAGLANKEGGHLAPKLKKHSLQKRPIQEKKQKRERKKTYYCLVCREEEGNSVSREVWIQCIECLNWMHELCAPGEVCNFCLKVLLYIPFYNEEEEFLSDHKYILIFQQRSEETVAKQKLFESDLDIHKTLELCKDLLTAVVGKKKNILSKEEFNEIVRKTNTLQRGLILHAIARLRGSTSIAENCQQPIQCFFTGPARSGKTFIINILMEVYNRFLQTDGLCNAYISCVTPGQVACAINGTTIHTAFTLTIHRRESHFSLSHHQLNQYRIIFKFVRVVIIDEISMCSAHLLHSINYRLQEITDTFDKPFGGLVIFLIGDLRQLPPVRATPIYKQSKNKMTSLSLWQNLQFYELDNVMHQSDEEFSNLLTAIGNGEKLTQQQQELIESRFVSNSSIHTISPNAIRLFYSNSKVDQFNIAVLRECQNFVSIANDIYTGYTYDAQLQKMRAQVNKMKAADIKGLPYEIMFVIDKMYMITKNIDVADGLANETIGKLKLIEYYGINEPLLPNIELQSDKHDTVDHPADFVIVVERIDELNLVEVPDLNIQESLKMKRIWLEFHSSNIGVKARLKAGTYMIENNISPTWVPIHQMLTTKSLGRGIVAKTINRKKFLVVAACAITIHKSQGGTFNKFVDEYERTHENSLVYVA